MIDEGPLTCGFGEAACQSFNVPAELFTAIYANAPWLSIGVGVACAVSLIGIIKLANVAMNRSAIVLQPAIATKPLRDMIERPEDPFPR